MPRLRLRILPLAAFALASGVFFSRSVLDQVPIDGRLVRLAFLPGWQALLAFISVAVLLLAGLGWLHRRRRDATGGQSGLAEIVLPLLALFILAVPYLPVLPDRWPVLQILAGPLVGVVWLVVAGLQVWALSANGTIKWPVIGRWPLGRLTVAVLVATVLISGLAAWRLTATPVFPGGDEPHYLVIAQSVWRDGDLDIFDNHQRGDYYEYSATALAPHYLRGSVDGGIYSIHPILMPVLMAPVYAAAGYAGVVAMLVLIASMAATLSWRWMRSVLDDVGAATFAWAAIVASTPFLLNTFTVYPETSAALAVMVAWVLTLTTPVTRPGVWRHVVIGVACATLPWFSTKYAPMSAALVLVAFARLWSGGLAAFMREGKAWAVATPYALSLLGWFAFFYAFWGSPFPTAPYGDHGQTSPLTMLRGAPGLMFDQEYGLMAFAPVYVLAATGLVAMWRAGRELRRQATEIVVVFGALLGSVAAFALWWGGSASPARPIVSGLLLLGLPIAVAYQRAPAGSAQRAAQYLLLLIGVGVAITLTVAQNGLLIDNGRDGTAALLEYWSPRWALWALAPTFTFHDAPLAYLQTLWWVAIAAGAAVVLARWRVVPPGAAALASIAVFSAALVIVALTMPLLPAGAPRPVIDLAARSRLASLDAFDASMRPIIVRYDEHRVVPSSDILSHLALQLTPASRTDRTPMRLIHNGRFSLPAGTYSIDVTFGADVPTTPVVFGVQVGRLGNPIQSSTLQPQPGERWRTALWLPVDVNFVGFRGPVELERAITRIVVTPADLVDASARPRVPPVLSATYQPGASLFFHDEQSYPERQGLWTRGQRTAAVTIAPTPGRTTPIAVLLLSSQANTALLSVNGWQREHELAGGQPIAVELPALDRGVIPLRITAARAFRPRDQDPASRDPRELGVWMEVKPQ